MRALVTLTVSAILVFLVFVAVMYLQQRRLIYLPDDRVLPELLPAELELQHWPDSSQPRGLVAEPAQAEVRGTVMVFHGNAGNALDRSYYVPALVRLGYRVILAEYPGYGGRAGATSQRVLVEDAAESVEMAAAQFAGPLYLWGESLGAGVVAATVAEIDANSANPVSVDGVILMTPWDSLVRLASRHYPYLPVKWLLLDRYDSVKNLEQYRGKVALVLSLIHI